MMFLTKQSYSQYSFIHHTEADSVGLCFKGPFVLWQAKKRPVALLFLLKTGKIRPNPIALTQAKLQEKLYLDLSKNRQK